MRNGVWRPYRVDAELPEAKELQLLGLIKRWQTCTLTPENGIVVASVDKLRGTRFKVVDFSLSVAQSYVDSERFRAQLLCTPFGNMMYGRSHESNGIKYISCLEYFTLVTANCYSTEDDEVTEWEIMYVALDKKSRNGHLIEVVEKAIILSMPTNLRARYTLDEQMKDLPLPSYEEVLAEITTKVEGIKDDWPRQKFLKFAPAMAVTYIRLFGGEADMPQYEENPEIIEEQPKLQSVIMVTDPSPTAEMPEREETPEIIEEQPVEQPVILVATGTDDPSPTEELVIMEATGTDGSFQLTDDYDPEINEQQFKSISEAKSSNHRRDFGKGKKPKNSAHNGAAQHG